MKKFITAIILAAGDGHRFGGELPKQFIRLNGKPILDHSISALKESNLFDYIIVVTQPKWVAEVKGVDSVVSGGDTRNESTYLGLLSCPSETTHVLIHDAVRPFIDRETLEKCIETLDTYDAVDVIIPTSDTIVVSDGSKILDVPNRSTLYRGQTPQAFRYKTILESYKKVSGNFTDDIGIALATGVECGVVIGSDLNMKITTPVDLFVAERVLQFKSIAEEVTIPDITGLKILLLGASGGIGSQVKNILLESGADVIDPTRDTVDLSKASLPRFLYQLKYNAIINCAGVIEKGTLSYSKVMNTNFRANILLLDLAKHTMKDGGNVVFLGSSSGLRGRADFPIYSASKAAVINLTESMAEEYKKYNIKINCVNPSRTTSKMTEYLGVSGGLDAKAVARVVVSYCNTNLTGHIVNLRSGV